MNIKLPSPYIENEDQINDELVFDLSNIETTKEILYAVFGRSERKKYKGNRIQDIARRKDKVLHISMIFQGSV